MEANCHSSLYQPRCRKAHERPKSSKLAQIHAYRVRTTHANTLIRKWGYSRIKLALLKNETCLQVFIKLLLCSSCQYMIPITDLLSKITFKINNIIKLLKVIFFNLQCTKICKLFHLNECSQLKAPHHNHLHSLNKANKSTYVVLQQLYIYHHK